MTYDAKATTRAMLDQIIAEMVYIETDALLGEGGWPPACYFDAGRADEDDQDDDDY